VNTWEKLFEAFLSHPVAKPLRDRPGKLLELLERGHAFIMLDGLDEIGSTDTRKALRDAVFDGFRRLNRCRWLLTSRIVGYEEVPFHLNPPPTERQGQATAQEELLPEDEDSRRLHRLTGADAVIQYPLLYVAPFNNEQVKSFAYNWFHHHETVRAERTRKAQDFFLAVTGHPDALRAARIPNLLTLLALIFRIKAFLPHGRARVYDLIAEAYLESIDSFRGILEVHYPLSMKKRWLAHVAFRMQSSRQGGDADTSARAILASREQVRQWLTQAMREDLEEGIAEKEAEKFIDYIGRRSGLLLPRGEGKFAFTHLSFQEYFTACFLRDQMTSFDWAGATDRIPGTGPEDIPRYAQSPTWRETMILLFEMMAEQPGWTAGLTKLAFGDRFQHLTLSAERTYAQTLATLLAELSVDPHSGFNRSLREASWTACWDYNFRAEPTLWKDLFPRALWARFERTMTVGTVLLDGDKQYQAEVRRAFEAVASGRDVKRLSLAGSVKLPDFGAPFALETLEWLDLSDCTGLTALPGLEKLSSLRILDLRSCTGLTALPGLEKLTNVKGLYLGGCTSLTALPGLERLTGLESLNLGACTGLTALPALEKLTRLERLYLDGCMGLTALPSLEKLTTLKELYLGGCTGLTALPGLEKLTGLEILNLSGCTGLTALPGLEKLTRLERLYLANCTGLTAMPGLEKLTSLCELYLGGCTGLTALPGLEKLTSLWGLNLMGCTALKELPPELSERPGLSIYR
jgi:internalin A